MKTLKMLAQNSRFRETLVGSSKTADTLGKFAPVLSFFFWGSGEALKVASLLISAPVQLLQAAIETISDEPVSTRDRYASIYIAILHKAYLEALVGHLKRFDLPDVSKIQPECGLPSLAEAEATCVYDHQGGDFQQERLVGLYEERLRYFLRFSVLDSGDVENEKCIQAVRAEAGKIFKLLKAEMAQLGWVWHAEQEKKMDLLIKQMATRLDAPGESRPGIDLDHAIKVFNSMPTDQVPSRAFLPKLSRLLHKHNEHFVGRTDELLAIAKALKGDHALAVTPAFAVTGMGGIGKTQLAVEFAHRYGRYFAGGVFWLNMEYGEQVPNEILACGDAMGLTLELGSLPAEKRVERVLQEWQDQVPRLLIFDNCEQPMLFKQWEPVSGGCRVLVTSRAQNWGRELGVRTLGIKTLHRTMSVALLCKLCPQLGVEPSLASEIADNLGHLPLALHLAGSYLETYSLTKPAQYLDELKATPVNDLHISLKGADEEWSPTNHDTSVGKTFDISYAKLDIGYSVDSTALRILSRAVWFAHGLSIPKWLLLCCSEDEGLDCLDLQKGLNRLIGLGVLELVDFDTVQVHRLTAAWVQKKGEDFKAREQVESTLERECAKVNRTWDPRPVNSWLTQLVEVANRSLDRKSKNASLLADTLGCWYHISGDLIKSKKYLEQALSIRKESLGPYHPDVAFTLRNLGKLLRGMRRLDEAKEYLSMALEIHQKVFGEGHLETARTLNNMGTVLKVLGDYSRARACYRKSLKIRLKYLGSGHPDVASSLNDYGILLRLMGHENRARVCYEKALDIRVKVYGRRHAETAQTINNLSIFLRRTGRLKEALIYCRESLQIRREIFGGNHIVTARSLLNLATILKELGELSEARVICEESLLIRVRILGENHAYTARNLSILGDILDLMGDPEGGLVYKKRALDIRMKSLGERHLLTARSLSGLAESYLRISEFKESYRHYFQACEIYKTLLGETDPRTARVIRKLGFLRGRM